MTKRIETGECWKCFLPLVLAGNHSPRSNLTATGDCFGWHRQPRNDRSGRIMAMTTKRYTLASGV